MIDLKSSYALLEKILILKRSPLFSGVSTSELRAVAAVTDELHFKHGDHIVSENEIGDALFLILSGSVKIVRAAGTERQIEIASLPSGECFGEMSAIDEEVRSATVLAHRDCTVLRIRKDHLLDVLRENPQISIELLKIFVKRLREADSKIEHAIAGRKHHEVS